MVKTSSQLAIWLLLFLVVVIYFLPQILISIYPGEAGVHYRRFFGGTVTDKVFGEGLQIIFPWDKLYVYNVRVQEVERSLDVLTEAGLTASVRYSIRYHPEYSLLGVLHQRVGKDYARTVVYPEVESALRTKIGQFSAEELYTTRHEIITQIVVEALGEASDRYVVIDDVIIRQISLPKLVEQSIQAKIMQKHYAESFVFRLKTEEQEAKRKKIEAEGISRFNTIVQGSITPDILKYKGIQATQELADSENSKIIVIGNGPEGLPIILGSDK